MVSMLGHTTRANFKTLRDLSFEKAECDTSRSFGQLHVAVHAGSAYHHTMIEHLCALLKMAGRHSLVVFVRLVTVQVQLDFSLQQ